ncbi:hypothetical protein FACS1894163_11810 [Spirochaetia bacterium]|nr:hypothetical protein FACS1894163_11810 [Spirochaetia bacterium]
MMREHIVQLNKAAFEDVLKGQKIEERRKQVQIYSLAFKKKRLDLPKYEKALNLNNSTDPQSSNKCKKAIRKLTKYIILDKKSTAKIIKIVTSNLRIKEFFFTLKHLIKNILYKTKLIGFIGN